MPGRSDKYGDDAAVGSLIDETVRQLMDRGFTRDESMKAAKRLISKARESGSLSEASQSSGRGRSGHSSSSTRRHDTMVKTRDNEHKRTDKTYGKSRGSGLDNFDTMRDALDDGNRLAKNTKSHDSRYDEPTDKYDYSFRYRAEYVSDGTSYAAYVAYSESYSSSSNDRPSGQGSRGYLEESRSERAPRDYSSRSSHRDDSRSSYRDDSRSSYRDDSRSSYRDDSRSSYRDDSRSSYRDDSRSSHRDEPRSKYQSGSRSYSTQEFRPSGGHDDDSRSKYQSGSRSYRTQEFRPSGGYHDDSRSKYQSQSKSRHQSQYKGSGVSMGVKPEANLYVILGVSASATADEIKNAHRKQCLKNHPDRGGSAAMMAQINQAYDVLKDKELRAFYDRTGTITSKGSSPDA